MTATVRTQLRRLSLEDAPGNGATITLHETNQESIADVNYEWIVLAIIASHDSAANGVKLLVSFDGGVTYDLVAQTAFTVAGGLLKFKKHLIQGGRMKLTYANSANVLTAFRGTVYLSNEQQAE